jgi:hypothetical protein
MVANYPSFRNAQQKAAFGQKWLPITYYIALMRTTFASATVIDLAYQWLCMQRRHWSANADVWDLRGHWHTEKHNILQALNQGEYYFVPLARVTKANGGVIHIWSARDALVLKALTLVLTPHLPVAKSCTHVKGHGGAKVAVRAVRDQLHQNKLTQAEFDACFKFAFVRHPLRWVLSSYKYSRVFRPWVSMTMWMYFYDSASRVTTTGFIGSRQI